MKRVLTALVLIPLVLLLVFKAPLWAVLVAVAVIALLALHEYLAIAARYGVQPLSIVSLALLAAVFLLPLTLWKMSLDDSLAAPWLLLVAVPMVLLTSAMRSRDVAQAFLAASVSCVGVFYVSVPLLFIVRLRILYFPGAFWLVVLFAAVWSGDAVAMYVGKAFGRHKLSPVISPNKTWEGAIGSVVGSVLACLAVRHYFPVLWRWDRTVGLYDGKIPPLTPSLISIVVLAILLNIAAQLGDLAESVIKRGAGVKDSGTLLPGHGGVLDRIDALLFAAPVLWYYLLIIRP